MNPYDYEPDCLSEEEESRQERLQSIREDEWVEQDRNDNLTQ